MIKSKLVQKITKLLAFVTLTVTVFIMMNKSVSGQYGSIEKYMLLLINIVPFSYLTNYLQELSKMKKKAKGSYLKYTPEILMGVGYQLLSMYLIVYQFPMALAILVAYLLISGLIKLLKQFYSTLYNIVKA